MTLKKIHVGDIRIGMYIHEICGSWMDHPFWKKSFRVANINNLQRLRMCGVHEVWIDVSKGGDVAAGTTTFSEEDEKRRVDDALKSAIKQNGEPVSKVEFHQEIETAKKIHAKAKKAVTAMFQEARMGRALQLDTIESLVDEINQSMVRNHSAMLSLARLKNKDDYTYLHSIAVCALMIALGRQLGMEGSDLREVGMAGLLHDIGKIRTPEEVLNKPGCLSCEEFEIMKAHPKHGWEILNASSGVSASTLDVCLHHHERVDGMGYPDKLSGETITLFSRMCAICDVYDAITSERCYKNAWEPAEAIRKMAEWKDGNYDESVFHAFIKAVGIYPVGTLIRLKSGRLGVVVEQSSKSLLTPKVTVFYSTKSNEHIFPEKVDLSMSADEISRIESAVEWGFDKEKLQRMTQISGKDCASY